MRRYVLGVMLLGVMLVGCAGPSEEKLEEVRVQYVELVEKHNEVAQAHTEVAGYEGEDELKGLAEIVDRMQESNLLELKEEEIDVLIEEMKEAVVSYEEHLVALADVKQRELEAVVVEIPVSINNHTGMAFSGLYLAEDGGIETADNLLEGELPFADGETLLGLVIYRDYDSTPWKLVVESEQDLHEIDIPTEKLDETGITVELNYDGEEFTIRI